MVIKTTPAIVNVKDVKRTSFAYTVFRRTPAMLQVYRSLSVILLMLTLLTISKKALAQTYCSPVYYYTTCCSGSPCAVGYNMTDVYMQGYKTSVLNDNYSTCSGSTANGFYDMTAVTGDTLSLEQGSVDSGLLTFNTYYYNAWEVWIDFNGDGVFADSEVVTPAGSTGSSFTCCKYTYPIKVTVPLSVPTGYTRMRVRYDYNSGYNGIYKLDPCTSTLYYMSGGASYFTNYVYYGATHDYTVNIVAAPACSGTPTVNVLPGNSQNVCSGNYDTLIASTPIATGFTYQWQSSTDGGITWSSVAGATNASYIDTVTANAQFRVMATCSGSGLSAYSNVDTVNLNLATQCYCKPSYYYAFTTSYRITNVHMGSSSSYSYLADNYAAPYGSSGYEDRTAVVAPDTLVAGNSYGDTITVQNSYYQELGLWIDLNDNGVYESSELLASNYCYGSNVQTNTVSIPASAYGGVHRMRVRLEYGCCSSFTPDPCSSTYGSYGSNVYYGDDHEYNVYIQSSIGTPVISGSTSYCNGSTISLSATDTTSGVSYTWSGPGGYSATGSSISISSAAYVNGGVYSVRASNTISGVTYYSAPAFDTVYVYPYPQHTSIGSNTPVCSGNVLSLYDTTLPSAGVTYSWSGPSSFSSSSADTMISNAQTTNGGTYTVTANNHGCSKSTTTSVTVYQTPSISSLTGTNPTSCSPPNGSVVINGLNAGTAYSINYTYNGGAVGPLSIVSNSSGQITISNLNTGVYDKFTATLNACPSAPAGPLTLTNSSTPAAPSASSNAPVCLNGTLKLTSSSSVSGVSFAWNGPAGFSSTSASPSITNIPLADSGNYYVYVTNSSGCASAAATLYVVVKPLPIDPVAGNNGPICSGPALFLTSSSATPGATYSWTGPAAFTSTAQNPTINPSSPSNAGIYTVYAVLNGCNSALPAYDTVIVKKTPANPTASSNSPVCQGPLYSINLYANSDSGAAYTWSGPAGTFSTQDPVIPNPPFSDSGDYKVSVTLLGCPALATATTHVSILPTPVAPSATPSYIYCQFAPVNILSATGTSLLWYTSPIGGTGTSVDPAPNDSVPGIFKYYVSQTASDGCESQRTVQTVTVKELPPVPYVGTPAYFYCQGDNATILSAIGTNMLWYPDSVSTTGSAAAPIPSTATPGTYYFYVSQTVNGCEGKRAEIKVTVTAKPGMPNGSATVTYCQNDVIAPLSVLGANLLWYNSASGGVGSTLAPTPITSYPKDTFYYYVTQTVNGCESDRKKITVIIKERPNVLIVGSQPYVCQFDTMRFSYYGSAPDYASFQWSVPEGAAIIAGEGKGPLVVRFDSAGKLPLTLLVNDNGCMSDLSTYTVDVRKAPIVSVSATTDACVGQPIFVQTGATNETIERYNWDFGGGNIIYGSTGPGPYGISFSQQGNYVVSLIAITNECPSLKISDTIMIHPIGDAHIARISSNNVCAGDSINFTVENPNAGYQYKWTPANFFGLQNNGGNVFGYIETSGEVRLTVTTEFGCISSDSVMIQTQSCCTLFFPNAFSPNGDGKNDVFRPLQGQGHHSVKEFIVVDRWGQTMFNTTEQNHGWDGTAHGVPQDIGTYYYTITYDCADGKTYHESGELMLVR